MLSNDKNIRHAPWHDGEIQLQEYTGAADRMAVIGSKVIRPSMTLQHRDFFTRLPFLVTGSVDRQGDVWAGLIAGNPGFMRSPTPELLNISAGLDAHDPVSLGINNGAAVGLLGIELNTRRRNRLNGLVENLNENGFSVEIQQSFGNCPRYIHQRDYEFTRAPSEHASIAPKIYSATDTYVAERITQADTFFVSSYVDIGGERQVDVSHRGGKSGFVKVTPDGTLIIPDYAGNLFFSTLGNFIKNPKAGLVFPDFETGDILQMTGDTEVILDSPEIGSFEGAQRLWTFTPRKIVFRQDAVPIKWTLTA